MSIGSYCTILNGNSAQFNSAQQSIILNGSSTVVTLSDRCCVTGNSSNVTSCTNTVLFGSNTTLSTISNSFVWSDGGLVSGGPFTPASTLDNCFIVRGGSTGSGTAAMFYTNAAATVGVQLFSGGTSWSIVCDINKKENLIVLDTSDILNKLLQIPIYQFNYKDTSSDLLCRGPVAQDWHTQFPSAKDNLTIDTLDLNGITICALQGLNKKVDDLQKENDELKSKLNLLTERFEQYISTH